MNAVIALIHRPPASDLHTYDPIYKWEENPSLLTSNEQSFVYYTHMHIHLVNIWTAGTWGNMQ